MLEVIVGATVLIGLYALFSSIGWALCRVCDIHDVVHWSIFGLLGMGVSAVGIGTVQICYCIGLLII